MICCGSMTREFLGAVAGEVSCARDVCGKHRWVLPVVLHPAVYSDSDEGEVEDWNLEHLGYYDCETDF